MIHFGISRRGLGDQGAHGDWGCSTAAKGDGTTLFQMTDFDSGDQVRISIPTTTLLRLGADLVEAGRLCLDGRADYRFASDASYEIIPAAPGEIRVRLFDVPEAEHVSVDILPIHTLEMLERITEVCMKASRQMLADWMSVRQA